MERLPDSMRTEPCGRISYLWIWNRERPLTMWKWSQMIGISRTPVREAVIQLSEESRIIEIFPREGCVLR